MLNLKQLSIANLAAVFIGLIAGAIAHVAGADSATTSAFATVLFFIAHHYFHLPNTTGSAVGDAGNAGSTGSDSSPGTASGSAASATTGSSTGAVTPSPTPTA